MTGVNYVTNDKGEKTALLIDLEGLRASYSQGADMNEFFEVLHDVLTVELSNGQTGRSHDEASNEASDYDR